MKLRQANKITRNELRGFVVLGYSQKTFFEADKRLDKEYKTRCRRNKKISS